MAKGKNSNLKLKERILETAYLLNNKRQYDYSISQFVSAFPYYPNLTYKYKKNLIENLLKNEYKEKAESKSEDYSFFIRRFGKLKPTITPLQILREETNSYFGNLYEARSKWKKFIPSVRDLARSSRLPLEFNEDTFLALGMIYGAGCLTGYSKTSGTAIRLSVQGDKKDVFFFMNKVAPLLESIFNIKKIYSGYHTNGYISPRISINSLAVSSWLQNEFNFPGPKTHKENNIPEFLYNKNFLKGVISTAASIKKGKSGKKLVIIDKSSGSFIKGIKNIFSYFHIKCGHYNMDGIEYLEFNKEQTKKTKNLIGFLNPKLYK